MRADIRKKQDEVASLSEKLKAGKAAAETHDGDARILPRCGGGLAAARWRPSRLPPACGGLAGERSRPLSRPTHRRRTTTSSPDRRGEPKIAVDEQSRHDRLGADRDSAHCAGRSQHDLLAGSKRRSARSLYVTFRGAGLARGTSSHAEIGPVDRHQIDLRLPYSIRRARPTFAG